MNDLSQLEKQLRSWTPRPPSPALKAKLFGVAAPVAEPAPEHTVPAWQWLAPAMAVFVVAMMSWTEGSRRSFVSSADAGVSSALNNPELAAYSPAHGGGHNAWPRATFDWTNERQTLSAATPVLATNSTTP